MAASGQVFETGFHPLNQKSPKTSSPRGRLASTLNAVAEKFEGAGSPGESLRLSKRRGFLQRTFARRDANTGEAITGTFTKPTLMSSLADQLLVIDQTTPDVLSVNNDAWTQYTTNVYSPISLRATNALATASIMAQPDGAQCRGIVCRTWINQLTGIPSIYFTDASDGTVVREPFTPGTMNAAGCITKVVSDGSFFFVVYLTPTSATTFELHATTYDHFGVEVDDKIIAPWTLDSTMGQRNFDVIFDPAEGVVVSIPDQPGIFASNGFALIRLTQTAGVISSAYYGFAGTSVGNQWAGLGFNNTGNGKTYVVTSFAGMIGVFEYAYEITWTAHVPAITQTWDDIIPTGENGFGATAVYLTDNVLQMTACMIGTDLHVLTSFVTTTGSLTNLPRTAHSVCHTGGGIDTVETIIGVLCASRPFVIDDRIVLATYYFASNILIDPFPTYYLYAVLPFEAVTTVGTGHVYMVGEFDTGFAGGIWVTANDGAGVYAYPFHLPHTYGTTDTHLPITYISELVGRSGLIPIDGPSSSNVFINAALGLQDVVVGPRYGTAIEYDSELLLPGPLGSDFNGSQLTEQGITRPLHIEGAVATTGYSYIAVAEDTMPNGDSVKSLVSEPWFTGSTAAPGATVVGQMLYQTNRPSVRISLYRTVGQGLTLGNVPGTVYHKVTNDVAPVPNDPNTRTWSITDSLSDADALTSEELYAGPGLVALQHDPMPSMRSGCVAANRAFVLGYDNEIYFSGEKTPGQALWFNVDTNRLSVPTNEELLAIAALDTRIIIIGTEHIWTFSATGLPDGNGAGGNIQTPEILPFPNGSSSGIVATMRDGVAYQSSAGGAWMITRGLENVQISATIDDQIKAAPIVGMMIDDSQKLYVAQQDDGNPACVWDDVAKLWLRWELPSLNLLCHSLAGKFYYADFEGVWSQEPFLANDLTNDSTPIQVPLKVQTDFIPISGVKNFSRIWDQLVIGDGIGPHILNVTTVGDTNGEYTTTKYQFRPPVGQPFAYSVPLPIDCEEASRESFLFEDSFDAEVFGDSFAIEMISFYVAVEEGLSRVPMNQRVAPVTHTVGGTIVGVPNAGMILRLNGGNDLVIPSGATAFTFTAAFAGGTPYEVEVFHRPTNQWAKVTFGTGFVGDSNVTSVVVTVPSPPAPPPPFAPTDIPGLKLWLDSAVGVTSDPDGGADPVPGATGYLSAWADQSGNVNDALQAINDNRPALGIDTINSLPAVTLGGVHGFRWAAGPNTILTPGAARTIYVVLRPEPNAPYGVDAGGYVLGFLQNTGGAPIHLAALNYSAGPTGYYYDLGGGNGTPLPTASAPAVLKMLGNGATVAFTYGGTPIALTANTQGTETGDPGYSVGHFEPFEGIGFTGAVACILVYDTALSSGNQALVEGYIASRYAL